MCKSTFMMWDPYCTCNKKISFEHYIMFKMTKKLVVVDYHSAQICVQAFEIKS
jgi:hypothetical protein